MMKCINVDIKPILSFFSSVPALLSFIFMPINIKNLIKGMSLIFRHL